MKSGIYLEKSSQFRDSQRNEIGKLLIIVEAGWWMLKESFYCFLYFWVYLKIFIVKSLKRNTTNVGFIPFNLWEILYHLFPLLLTEYLAVL